MSEKALTTAIILAAGQSKRMGPANKLLVNWRGKPLVEYVCHAALDSQCHHVVVVTGHQQQQIFDALQKLGGLKKRNLIFAHNAHFAAGMASSIRTGVQSAIELKSNNILILLGDMPGISSNMIDKITKTANSDNRHQIIVSTCEGRRGNPLLWKGVYFSQLLQLKGDQGARQIIADYEDNVVEVELGKAARFDLDTQQAFDQSCEPEIDNRR